jgi:hypothetical protein
VALVGQLDDEKEQLQNERQETMIRGFLACCGMLVGGFIVSSPSVVYAQQEAIAATNALKDDAALSCGITNICKQAAWSLFMTMPSLTNANNALQANPNVPDEVKMGVAEDVDSAADKLAAAALWIISGNQDRLSGMMAASDAWLAFQAADYGGAQAKYREAILLFGQATDSYLTAIELMEEVTDAIAWIILLNASY